MIDHHIIPSVAAAQQGRYSRFFTSFKPNSLDCKGDASYSAYRRKMTKSIKHDMAGREITGVQFFNGGFQLELDFVVEAADMMYRACVEPGSLDQHGELDDNDNFDFGVDVVDVPVIEEIVLPPVTLTFGYDEDVQ